MPPNSTAAFKIMRRAGLGPRQGSAGISTPASSSAPSKATSDAGLETNSEEGILSPIEGTPNKDKSKLTREEREAQYKAARERIFGDFQESVTSESAASTGENSASLSRSSSSSGKKKQRKHKTPKDDSFEARSAYVPSYAPLHMSHMQAQYQPHYQDQRVYQGSYQAPSSSYGATTNYGTTPTQAYPNFETSMQYNNTPMGYGPSNSQPFSPADSWSSMQTPSPNGYFNYSASLSSYQQNVLPMMSQMNNQYMPQSHPNMQQPQSWINNQYQAPYPLAQNQSSSNISGWPGYQPNHPMGNPVSYGHGPMLNQNFGGNTNQQFNAQNANSNNYSRSLFNPQTRSFVPNDATSRSGARNNGRKKPSPASSQNQSQNSSIAAASKSFGSENSATPPPTRPFDTRVPINLSSPKPISMKEDSLQQKYGAPAHLPKKPPPSQVMLPYDADSSNNNANEGSGISVLSIQTGTGPGIVEGVSTSTAAGRIHHSGASA